MHFCLSHKRGFTAVFTGGEVFRADATAMKKPIIQSFMESIREADTEKYLKALVFCFGAPTIRGLKAATLLNLRRGGEDVRPLWRARGESWLRPLGVEAILLNGRVASASGSALVMIYRRRLLERVLASKAVRDILADRGYAFPFSLDACLEHLQKRFRLEFPHEIGLFLDYPPEDVRGFLEHRGAESLAVGYWKVYGNVEKARRAFRRYRRAECDAARSLLNGNGFRL